VPSLLDGLTSDQLLILDEVLAERRRVGRRDEGGGGGKRPKPDCGTRGGYERHRRLKEETCPACRVAEREYEHKRYIRKKIKAKVNA
jgi:hypothetical protein